ncbi:MAG: 50S ribosomal protein L16 [Candidatus Kuenenbacteria bacterium]
MLMPKKVKHRKWHKMAGMSGRKASRMTKVNFGSFGLKSLEKKWITSKQIESARKVIVQFIRKGGKIWIRIFPDKPITAKSAEVPMGSGKGVVDHYVAVVKPGTIMFEMDGIPENKAKEAMKLASYKLPVKTKFVTR